MAGPGKRLSHLQFDPLLAFIPLSSSAVRRPDQPLTWIDNRSIKSLLAAARFGIIERTIHTKDVGWSVTLLTLIVVDIWVRLSVRGKIVNNDSDRLVMAISTADVFF